MIFEKHCFDSLVLVRSTGRRRLSLVDKLLSQFTQRLTDRQTHTRAVIHHWLTR